MRANRKKKEKSGNFRRDQKKEKKKSCPFSFFNFPKAAVHLPSKMRFCRPRGLVV